MRKRGVTTRSFTDINQSKQSTNLLYLCAINRKTMRKLLILEVNEIPFRIYDDFVAKHPESTLAQVFNQSAQYETVSTDQGELHPWSTWPTLYRGVDNTKHEIKDIGEDLKKRDEAFPPVWQVLTKQGIHAGVFASLHTHPLPQDLTNYDFLVPDPFANGDDTLPEKVRPFQAFNLAMSRKSGRSVDKGIDKSKAVKLLFALPGLGLRVKTIMATMSHLIAERFAGWKAIRRRTFQSILAFDLYLKLLKKHKPTFTTFFSNHVASSMHRYWAAAFPEDYKENNLPKDWIDRYGKEIEICMWKLDDMLEDIVKFLKKNPEYKLMVASSMGQAATEADLISHELFLSDYARLNQLLGDVGIQPVSAMHPQYNFKVSEKEAERVKTELADISLNGEPLKFRQKEKTFFSVDLGYPNVETFDVLKGDEHLSIKDLGFEIKPIDDQSGGTAYHIPEGALFVYDIQHPVTPERKQIDLREVAPSILKGFGVSPPAYMLGGGIKELSE